MAHVPVLAEELVEVLEVKPDSRVVDCTFGAGGHAALVAAELGSAGVLVACDQDPVAAHYYRDLKHLPKGFKATRIYLDLGVSSMQIDTPERGFSYSYDAPLDMRMDPSLPVTAADIVNSWAERDLTHLFGKYGEERFSGRIAHAIVQRRAGAPYKRTCELVDTIKQAIPTPARFGQGNPARRVFQALRIEVNDELGSLERALPLAFDLLEPGGIVAVISFHSLEDRIVKEFFAAKARGCTCPPDFPVCACGGKATGKVLTPKPRTPGERELELNPRSASAKLRALRKL
jgi:16S rRNA (cytosine1402-N4)-methyltransferase